MNENPEGTPNPLNPVQGADPVGEPSAATVEQPLPAEQPVEPVQAGATEQPIDINNIPLEPVTSEQPAAPAPAEPAPTESVAEPAPEPTSEPVSEPASAEQPVEPALEPLPNEEVPEPLSVETVSEQLSVSELAPEGLKMESKKKSGKGALITAIVLLILAIVAGVAAAIVVLNPFAKSNDAVPAAIAKLMRGEISNNVAMSGTIDLSSDYDSAVPFSYLTVSFDGGVQTTTNESFVNAKIAATLTNGAQFGFDASEVHSSANGLFIKLSNVYNGLEDYYDYDTEDMLYLEENCFSSDDGTNNCLETKVIDDCLPSDDGTYDCLGQDETLLDYIGVFDVIDDEWINIPDSKFSNLTDMAPVDPSSQCLIDAVGKLKEYGNNFEKMYKDNPFIDYSTDNLKITKKTNTLYHLSVDKKKFTGFINSMANSGFANELLACTNSTAINEKISEDEVAEIIAFLPDTYVEIDDNNNFTRVYLSLTGSESLITATADISISYPSSITINEPEEYIEFNQDLSNILTQFFQQSFDVD